MSWLESNYTNYWSYSQEAIMESNDKKFTEPEGFSDQKNRLAL